MPGTHPHIRCTKSLPPGCPSRSRETGLQDHWTHSLLAEAFISKALNCASAVAGLGGCSPDQCRRTPGGKDAHLISKPPRSLCLLHVWMLTFPICLYPHCWTCNQQEVYLSGDDCRIIFQGCYKLLSTAADGAGGEASGWCCAVEQLQPWLKALSCLTNLDTACKGTTLCMGRMSLSLDKQWCFHSVRKFSIPLFIIFYWNADA